MTNNRPSVWREFWSLARPYWGSAERWSALGLLSVIIGMNLGLVYLDVLFNDWNKTFYDALQNKDEPIFWEQMVRFSWLAGIYIVVAIYQFYLTQMLQIRWRRWMTDRHLNEWLAGQSYYRMQLLDKGTDNPDQRIADDIKLFVQLTLDLSIGLLSSIVSLLSFMFILWTISGPLAFTAFGIEINIPGYMLWAAVLYAVVGSTATHLIGRPLIRLNFNQQRYEADFRFSLIRLRENAEGAALLGGEAREKEIFTTRFSALMANFWAIMKRRKQVNTLVYGYRQVAIIFPFLVASPRYFSGAIQLGDLIQISSAFGQVQTALSYLVTSYTEIAEWRAVVIRLSGFRQALTQAATPSSSENIDLQQANSNNLSIEKLDLCLPDGRSLIGDTNFSVQSGERVLVMGPSGSGKSTLFRAISGLWRFGDGKINLPANARAMFLPQKPYMPLGKLVEALTYPEAASNFSIDACEQALHDVGLSHFIPRLDEVQNWSQILSGGEQQRLSFARALLKKPDWLFLDEATAALDPSLETMLYENLHKRLPNITILGIAHREHLLKYHDRVFRLELEKGKAANLTERMIEPVPVNGSGA